MFSRKSNFELKRKIVKAELLPEGIFFLIHLFDRDGLVIKELEIEKTKTPFIISVLVSWISNFFTNKTSLTNKWMSLSSSNLALRYSWW